MSSNYFSAFVTLSQFYSLGLEHDPVPQRTALKQGRDSRYTVCMCVCLFELGTVTSNCLINILSVRFK